MSVRLGDVVAAAAASIAAVAAAPAFYDLLSVGGFGPLTRVLAELVVPSILIGVLVSIGVSAVRRDDGVGEGGARK